MTVIWINRIVRWALGAFLIVAGIVQGPDWLTIAFGGLVAVTGFLKPGSCITGQCNVPPSSRQ